MYRISPSAASSLLECPRCLWLYANEGIKRPRGIYPSLPDGMDNVFKNYFDSYRKRGELPPEISGRINATLFSDVKKLKEWRESNFGRGGLKAEFPEYQIILQGAIDDLLITPDGHYSPFDFKTRGYPTKEDTHEHYRYQLDLYALLFEKNGLPPAELGYLLFFWPISYKFGLGKFETELVKMEVNPRNGLDILKRVHEIVAGPIPKSHTNCEYCIYRKTTNLD